MLDGMAETGAQWKLGQRPALDGLRGMAILLVLLAHGFPRWFVSAGPVGVTVFFTLSGFLITSLLLAERERMGRVNLAAFYRRRALRLLPALAAFLVAMFALWMALGSLVFAGPRRLLTVALYLGNIGALPAGVDLTSHTWSLAVEEQFYIAFPLLFLALLRRVPRHALVLVMTLAVAGSAIERVLLWHGGAGWERVYYSTDTNAGALLVGGILAVLMHAGRARAVASRWATVLVAAMLPFGLLGESLSGRAVGPVVVELLTVGVLYAATSGQYHGWLTCRPLRLIGERSYGLYLWHLPIFSLAAAATGHSWFAPLTVLPVVALVTWASWRFVEQPFLLRKRVAEPIESAAPGPAVEHEQVVHVSHERVGAIGA